MSKKRILLLCCGIKIERKKIIDYRKTLPVVALRGLVVFPGTTVSFDIARSIAIKAIEKAMESDREIILVTQKNIEIENPGILDLYKVGCVGKVKQFAKTGIRTARVMIEVRLFVNSWGK